MGKLIYVVAMSLDGFISAANVRPEAGLGDGGEKLHEWTNSTDPHNREVMEGWVNTRATIVGRTNYDLSVPYWGADGPLGAVRIPTIIVTHSVPQDVPQNSVYTFVNGIEAAFEKAQELAGDLEISITGSDVARQFLQRGLIDELWISVAPVLFGSGTPLFGDLENKYISLEPLEVINTPEVIHMRFRVLK